MLEPEQLAGGMGNGGQVVRIGNTVRRPTGAHTNATSMLLQGLAARGFQSPQPLGTDEHGRSCFGWIKGDVPTPPYPAWSLTDRALASVGRLLRTYHETARTVPLRDDLDWCEELADPAGGTVVCHNDVCPENVVFRNGEAVALLDFDFAAPGRPVWDLAQTARMWVPLRPPQFNGERAHLDPTRRLRVLADAYELEADQRREFVAAILESRRVASRFVRRRVKAGEPAFVEAWQRHGGAAGDASILSWLQDSAQLFMAVLAANH